MMKLHSRMKIAVTHTYNCSCCWSLQAHFLPLTNLLPFLLGWATYFPPSPLQTYFLTHKLTFKRNYLQYFHIIFYPHYLISGKMAQPRKCLKLWNLFMAMSSQFVWLKQVTYVLLNCIHNHMMVWHTWNYYDQKSF